MMEDFRDRAMKLPPNELRELDQLLDQNPRLMELLLKMFPELQVFVESGDIGSDADDGMEHGGMPGQPRPSPAVGGQMPQAPGGLHGAKY